MPLKERLRAKKRRQQASEQAELESAEKKKRVHKSDVLIAKIDFSELISSASEVKQHLEDQKPQVQLQISTNSTKTQQQKTQRKKQDNTQLLICKKLQPAILAVKRMSLNIRSSGKDIKRQREISQILANSKVLFYTTQCYACARLSKLLAYSESSRIRLDETLRVQNGHA